MLKNFSGRAHERVRLGVLAVACAWPLASPLAATLAAPLNAPPAAVSLPAAEPLDWRQANDAVGRFLRGHIDLLKAEPETPPPAQEDGKLLSLDEATALALARRPDLFDRPGLSASEQLTQRREALALRLNVQQLWSRAVLTASQARLSEEAAAAAQTGAELGRRMAQVGNWSRAQWLQEHAQWLDTQMAYDQARAQAMAAREALVRKLALTGELAQIRLPATLPPPLPQLVLDGPSGQSVPQLLAQARKNHPALTQARWEADRAAQTVGTTQLMRARSGLQSAAQQTAAGAAGGAGDSAAIVPTLDTAALAWNHALDRALTAEQQADALEAELESGMRTAWQQLRVSQNRSAQLTQLLTLQTELLADMQRRYNGMLKSTWDLLASARERMAVEQRLHQAQQQQWMAQAALHNLLAGGDASAIETDSAEAGSGPRRSPGH